jgi:hypothetical protein
MMQQAIKDGAIPQECFAKKNSHCNYAVLTRQFFCDSSRVQHHPAGLGECNFGECYDQAAHPPTSITLHSWGIAVSTAPVLLKTMQVIQYFLKTGLGESSESYGGTTDHPNSGLGQGSGASPPGFLALSSRIVNAYRRMGHGVNIMSAYIGRLYSLAAVMYVNDTDMLHWPSSPYTNDKELVSYVQQATSNWGHLTQASGSILKAPKCSIYFLSYKFVKGRAKLKKLCDLPKPVAWISDGRTLHPAHIMIPQPQGPDIPIITHNVMNASKMLEVYSLPSGNNTTHINQMVKRGLDWFDSLHTKPLPHKDIWTSFFMQLYPAITWGLVTVVNSPKDLDKKIHSLYYKALPLMGISCNIKKEWRTLPAMYQGLGLPSFPLLALSQQISFLQSNWGAVGSAQSDSLSMA